MLLSIHCNASSNGAQRMTATGWCAYTRKGETENLFYDAFPDYRLLLSERGVRAIVGSHVDGICDYLRRK